MSSVVITLPDGTQKTIEAGSTALAFAKQIGRRLEEAAVAAKVDGKIVDLNYPLNADCQISIITRESKEGLEVIRHSTAHLLAMAVKELFPESQATIGPVTEDGFFYDFDRPTQFVPEDLPKIEKRMTEIASRKLDITRKEYKKEEVIQIFKALNEDFKVEIIQDIPDSVLSTYSQGDWVDLCRGPHLPNTARLGKFKLLSLAGAYWRGDEKNKMLQRIYGTAFATQKELDDYLQRIEEAKRRDHRRLGPELELFTFLPIAPAMPFFLPKGTLLYQLLTDYIRKEMRELDYQEVICPQIMSGELWKTSGHIQHYRENMYCIEEKDEPLLAIKPMNCPGHASLFAMKKHSYRDLPLRYSEFSKLHRAERGGVTHGLLRVRAFSQDDAHIFCQDSQEQVQNEILTLLNLTNRVYKKFGFEDVAIKVATRPELYAGTLERWEMATKTLTDSLDALKQPYEIVPGDGAFYGPKIEFHIRDSLKRSWQCGTIQFDTSLPEKFNLEYIDADGKAKRPIMLHRAVLGSVERFLGIMIEHFAGHFPLWIAPVQVKLINVMDDQKAYAEEIAATLKSWGMRVELDSRNEKLGYRIREAQLQKIPMMIVLGNKEREGKLLSLRRSNGDKTDDLTLERFKQLVEAELNLGGTGH